MTGDNAISRVLTRSPLVASVLYGAIVVALIFATFVAGSDILERRQTLNENARLLAELQARSGRAAGALLSAERPGSPFLEGPTVTVAGANLLQRVAASVQSAGGSVQSSSVDVTGTQVRDGFVALLMSCEMDQPALQKVLYDIEGGMPFLFIDQLDVQAPQMAAAAAPGGVQRIRVVLGVSGQWKATP